MGVKVGKKMKENMSSLSYYKRNSGAIEVNRKELCF